MPKKAEKPGVVRLECDDLPTQDGWVEMCSYVRTRHLPYLDSLDLTVLTEDVPLAQKVERMQLAYEFLASFVTDWDWKDRDGSDYAKPDAPEAFGDIRPSEFNWLMKKINEVIGADTDFPKANETSS